MPYLQQLSSYAEFGRGKDKKKRALRQYLLKRGLQAAVLGGALYAGAVTPQGKNAIAAGRRAAAGLKARGATLVSSAGGITK